MSERDVPLVLVHGGDPAQRAEVARALRERAIGVLLSSRPAEAAKCATEPRLAVVVALSDAAVLGAMRSLAPALRTMWAGGGPLVVDASWSAVTNALPAAPPASAVSIAEACTALLAQTPTSSSE